MRLLRGLLLGAVGETPEPEPLVGLTFAGQTLTFGGETLSFGVVSEPFSDGFFFTDGWGWFDA